LKKKKLPNVETKSSLCTFCGMRPCSPGHPYCGKTCALEGGYLTKGAAARQSVPSIDLRQPSPEPFCEHCGVRPRLTRRVMEPGKPTTYNYCGNSCRNAHREGKTRRCQARSCRKWVKERFCGDKCAMTAVRAGDVDGCSRCRAFPAEPPSEFCSSECEDSAVSSEDDAPPNHVDRRKPGVCTHCKQHPKRMVESPYCSEECDQAATARSDTRKLDKRSKDLIPGESIRTYTCCLSTVSTIGEPPPVICPICAIRRPQPTHGPRSPSSDPGVSLEDTFERRKSYSLSTSSLPSVRATSVEGASVGRRYDEELDLDCSDEENIVLPNARS